MQFMEGKAIVIIVVVAVLGLTSLSCGLGAPVPPAWPQYMFIEHGTFNCTYGTGGPPCVTQTFGSIVGYYAFDDNGDFLNYREDSVLVNSPLTYNREYAYPEGTTEYFLINSPNVTSLQCVNFSYPVQLSRYWLSNATFVNQTTFAGVDAYEFSGSVILNGTLTEMTGWVSVDTNLPLGWSSGPITYTWYKMVPVESFPPDLFTKPELQCIAP